MSAMDKLRSAVEANQREGLAGSDAYDLGDEGGRGGRGGDDVENMVVSEELLVALGVGPRLAKEFMGKQIGQWKRIAKNSTGGHARNLGLEDAIGRQKAYYKLLEREAAVEEQQRKQRRAQRARAAAKAAAYEKKRKSAMLRKHAEEEMRMLQSRALRKRDREEVMYRKLFDKCLKLQRDRLREERRAIKEENAAAAAALREQKDNMARYHAEQLAMVKEQLRLEAYNKHVAQKAQNIALGKLEHSIKSSLSDQLDRLRREIDASDQLYWEEFPVVTEERLTRMNAILP